MCVEEAGTNSFRLNNRVLARRNDKRTETITQNMDLIPRISLEEYTAALQNGHQNTIDAYHKQQESAQFQLEPLFNSIPQPGLGTWN